MGSASDYSCGRRTGEEGSGRAEGTRGRAEGTRGRAEGTRGRAEGTRGRAEGTRGRAGRDSPGVGGIAAGRVGHRWAGCVGGSAGGRHQDSRRTVVKLHGYRASLLSPSVLFPKKSSDLESNTVDVLSSPNAGCIARIREGGTRHVTPKFS